jgi:hypothetical protein
MLRILRLSISILLGACLALLVFYQEELWIQIILLALLIITNMTKLSMRKRALYGLFLIFVGGIYFLYANISMVKACSPLPEGEACDTVICFGTTDTGPGMGVSCHGTILFERRTMEKY